MHSKINKPATGASVQAANGYDCWSYMDPAGFVGLPAEVVDPAWRALLELWGISPFVIVSGDGYGAPDCYVRTFRVANGENCLMARCDYMPMSRSALSIPAH